jgi:hypothetical protein
LLEILRTVKVSLVPVPRRWMTTPVKVWMRSLPASMILKSTLTVSPARNSGMSERFLLLWMAATVGCMTFLSTSSSLRWDG